MLGVADVTWGLSVGDIEPVVSWQVGTHYVQAMDFVRHESGTTLLAVAHGGEVGLFDPGCGEPFRREDDGAELRLPIPRGNPVYDLAYLPRPGAWPHLVVIADSATRVYDLSTGREVSARQLVNVRLGVVDALQDLAGAATIVVAGRSDDVYLWRDQSESPVVLAGHQGPVRNLRVLRAQRWLAVGHEGGITVWNLATARPERVATFGGEDVRSVVVVQDSLGRSRLASAGEQGIRLWDPETGERLAHFARGLGVSALAAVHDEDGDPLLAAAGDDGVTLWSPATEERAAGRLVLPRHGHVQVLARILTSTGTLLAAGDNTGWVTVWRLSQRRYGAGLLGKHRDWVNALTVLDGPGVRQGRLLASASDDGTVQLWDLRSNRLDGPPLEHDTQVQAVATAGDGQLATGGENGTIRIWSVAGGTVLRQWAAGHRSIRDMVGFRTADGWRLVTAGTGHCLLWDPATGELLRSFRPTVTGDDTLVRATVATELDGGWLIAAADSAGRIDVWDAATGLLRWCRQAAHDAQIRALEVVSYGSRTVLASGGEDGTIHLWDLRTGDPAGVIAEPHAGAVAALRTVTDGTRVLLASGSADHTIRLWDVAEQPAPAVSELINAHASWVRTLSVVRTASGETILVSGSDDGTIRLWGVVDGNLLRTMPRLGLRGFRDRLARTDLLDRADVVRTLADLLQPEPPALHRLPTATFGPQVVMVQGAWGAGKSSVMHDLRAALQEAGPPPDPAPGAPGRLRRLLRWLRPQHADELTPFQAERLIKNGVPPEPAATPAAVQRTVTAWFDPWAHQLSGEIWSSLAWTLIQAVGGRLGDRPVDRQRYWLGRNLPRLDRAAVRRAIRQRVWRPTVALLAALFVPLTVALLAGRFSGLAGLVLGLVAAVLTVFAGYAVRQYLWGRISAYLPADVLTGPIQAQVAGPDTPLLRGQLYFASTGRVYRANQDIHEMVQDLARRGYQLVVFIDDLDRCTTESITEVFEAINSFLIYPDQDLEPPRWSPRFVIGLDPTVVANRIAGSPEQPPGTPPPNPEDPNPGWSLLRKMSQLTVVLPKIHVSHTTRLLRFHAPPGTTSPPATAGPAATPPAPAPAGDAGAATRPEAAAAPVSRDGPALLPPADRPPDEVILALERDPAVQQHLRDLVRLQPRPTMRETKRLLTLWGFYLRLLATIRPAATVTTRGACDAMTLAELVRRFPALVPALAQPSQDRTGLRRLVAALHADADDPAAPAWHGALTALALDTPELAVATTALRHLLQEHGTDGVVEFADFLL